MTTQPAVQGLRRRNVRAVWLVGGAVVLAAAVALLLDRMVFAQDAQPTRPDLQQVLDGLVTGEERVAPGVTAYVSGPSGTWAGSAGVANVKTGEPMRPDARLYLDSLSKAWTATLILQLVAEGRMRLEDPVERWLPSLLPAGERITVRQLLEHTSGLVDDESDITPDPMRAIQQVRDPALRTELEGLLQRVRDDPTAQGSAMLWARFAAALPLRSKPGTTYHYSNLGYTIAGLIAAEVGGAPLGRLYRERLSEPLGLASATYQPQGEVTGPHPREYSVRANGELVDATGWYRVGNGAGAGIVSSAADEARFLTELMQGKVLPPAQLAAMQTPNTANGSYGLGLEVTSYACAGVVYRHDGSSYATASAVVVSADGERVAVVLLNGNTLSEGFRIDPRAGSAVVAAADTLFCAA